MKMQTIMAVFLGAITVAYCELPELEKPTANLTEKWNTNGNNWGVKKLDSSTMSLENCWSSNMLSVVHDASSNTAPRVDIILGGTNASGGRFSGNYVLKAIEAVEFDVRTSGLAYNPSFAFQIIKPGATGIVWRYRSAVIPCDTASSWIHVTIPMDFSTNWVSSDYWLGQPTPPTAGPLFNEDKANIAELMVRLEANKIIPAPEQFSLTNLKIVGPWSGPFTSNGVSVAWLAENGLSLESAFLDTDSDGITNNVEFLASTNPNDSNDVFRVEIGKASDGRPILKWKENNKYARYDLLEGTDLSDPNTFHTNAVFSNMQGLGAEREADVLATPVTGPRFYKVQIKVK